MRITDKYQFGIRKAKPFVICHLLIYLFVIAVCLFAYFSFTPVHAANYSGIMSNSNYILQMGNLNTAAGNPANSNYKLGVTVGQTAPGLYSGVNYKVRSGFQYIHSIIPFAFSISQTIIDFGTLYPTTLVKRTNDLTVSNGSANGYSVTAIENHQLLVPSSGSLIPNTACDNGTCTDTVSAAWTSTLTYGFGYRCDNISGSDCPGGFSNSTYYKQFADQSKSDSPQSVMASNNVGRNKEVQITYMVNISSTQPAGLYTNVITYVATPTF
ncbi:hypothetical protein M1615_03810 [Patescibacteria group bacterium]|nr:hypothetical protein [Patescibacteria group bacterium]MCL5010398.1 hypothetical protein [Patescibacteria group bacterium]